MSTYCRVMLARTVPGWAVPPRRACLRRRRPRFLSTIYFRVEAIPGKGRGIVAARDLPAGFLFFEERPIVSFPDLSFSSEMEGEFCPNCFRKNSLFVRARSLHEGHCSSTCQTEAFEGSGKLYQQLKLDPLLEYCSLKGKKFPLVTAKMIAAALLKGKDFHADWNDCNDLCFAGHGETRPAEWEEEHALIKAAFASVLDPTGLDKIFSVLDIDFYCRLIGTFHLNMMRLHPDVGVGSPSSILLHTGSMFNHSCNPNVVVGWRAFHQPKSAPKEEPPETVHAEEHTGHSDAIAYFCIGEKDVAQGEELCISYVPAEEMCDSKRVHLAENYGIACPDCAVFVEEGPPAV